MTTTKSIFIILGLCIVAGIFIAGLHPAGPPGNDSNGHHHCYEDSIPNFCRYGEPCVSQLRKDRRYNGDQKES